jgi:vacuolar protein sorting-associated protein 29
MANFGELVLVLGDLHIPTRASKIPAAFKRMLVPNKMQHVICCGNLSVDDYEELRALSPNLHVVAGEYDDGSTGLIFPESRVIQIGSFRIGIIHGHQILPWNSPEALARMRRKMNVDVLISGHTHKNEVTVQDGVYHINPVRRCIDSSPFRMISSPSVPGHELQAHVHCSFCLLFRGPSQERSRR